MNTIYLSLTTRPERLESEHFKRVYQSLKKQTIPFNKFIINLSVEEFTYNIPDYLFEDKNIILNETEICGPCTKLIGSIDIIPDDTVVIVLDDDIVMRNNFIESLYKSYLLHPDKVSSHFVNQRPYFREVAGFGGYVFNINVLRNIKPFYYTMPECCKKIDDTWISWCIYKLNVDVTNTIERNPWDNVLDIPNTDEHPDWYELCKHTDRIKLLTDAFLILNK